MIFLMLSFPSFVPCYHIYLRKGQRTWIHLRPSAVGKDPLAMHKSLLPDGNVPWSHAGATYIFESEEWKLYQLDAAIVWMLVFPQNSYVEILTPKDDGIK